MGIFGGRSSNCGPSAMVLAASIFAALCFFMPASHAQAPSAEQMKYFKSLSPSEQKRLAEQFGVSLPDLQGSQGGQQQRQDLPQTIYRQGGERGQQNQQDDEDQRRERQNQEDRDREDELPIFGMNVFAGQATSFTPIGDLPVPADYIVAPGDEIAIQVYGKLNEEYQLLVSRDGNINIPNLGPFSVVGKRFAQVREEIHQKFSQQVIGAQVSVSLGELHSMQIYVLGDARQPGAYQLSSLATATQAIIAAGGIADTGSLRKIEVRRGGQLLSRIDLYDLLLHGNRGGDLRLQSGDAVFIPPAGARVQIEGEVLRPAIYELGPKGTSLDSLVNNAGGALPSANTSRLRLERKGNQGRDVFTLNLSQPQGRQFALQEGDQIYLDKQNEGYRNSVQLTGAFINAGQHGFQEGMRVADLLTHPKTVLRDDADDAVALLVRQEPRQQISVRYVHLRKIMKTPQSRDNVLLRAEDELVVLPAFVAQDASKKEDRENKTQKYDNNANDPLGEASPYQHQGAMTERRFNSERGFVDENGNSSDYPRQGVNSRALMEFDSKQRKLMSVLATQQDQNLSAEETRQRREALEELSTLRVARRRAELLAPIVEKLREQAGVDAYQNVVEIAGEIKYPGSYPYQSGMSLETLLQIAGGLKENAFTEHGELARMVDKGDQLELQTSRVAISGMSPEKLTLRARDKINIFERPEWRDTVAVEVTGEVRFPGTYTVVRGTGFKELINRAGGFTEFAFPEGAVFSREKLKEKEQEQIERLRERLKEEVATLSLRKSSGISGLSVSPTEAIDAVDKLNSVEALGRLVIDLPALVAADKNVLTLEDGDFLHIPSHSRTVTVVGEVQYPSSHLFEQDVNYKDYIDRAGGTRQRADRGRIYIIRANGQVVVPKNSWFGASVKEGDTIVVPINAQYVDKLSVFGSVTQILYQLGIAYDVIKN